MHAIRRLKIITIISSVSLLAASCGLFGGSGGPAGVIKTVDGGADWQFSNAIQGSKTATLASLNVSKMAFDPTNHETIFVGGYNGGLYKSTDSGATWKNILSKIYVYNFVINPQDIKTIYVCGTYGNNGRVLKTTDGGATWQEIYNEASPNNAVRSIALNPTNVNEMVIGTDNGSVIQSSDGGLSWKLWANANSRVSAIVWQGSDIYFLLRDKGAAMATGLGAQLQNLMGAATPSQIGVTSIANSAGKNPTIFYQMYVDTISPNLMYLTTDVGLFKSSNGGQAWNYLPLPTQGGTGEAHAIAVSPSSSNVVFTSIDATVYKSTDGGATWQTQPIATGGFINYILIDPQLPQIVYGGVYGG